MSAGADLNVRGARPGDADMIGRLLHEFNDEYGEPTPGPRALAKRARGLLERGEVSVLLAGAAPDGLAVLRFSAAIWTGSLECLLAELYVAPARRGSGLGRALMGAAIDLARLEGSNHMYLGTSEDDVAARRLYESLGFSNRQGGAHGPINYLYQLDL